MVLVYLATVWPRCSDPSWMHRKEESWTWQVSVARGVRRPGGARRNVQTQNKVLVAFLMRHAQKIPNLESAGEDGSTWEGASRLVHYGSRISGSLPVQFNMFCISPKLLHKVQTILCRSPCSYLISLCRIIMSFCFFLMSVKRFLFALSSHWKNWKTRERQQRQRDDCYQSFDVFYGWKEGGCVEGWGREGVGELCFCAGGCGRWER